MAKRLLNPKTELRPDVRGMRHLLQIIERQLKAPDTDWVDLHDLARDLEAAASAFACNALENAEVAS